MTTLGLLLFALAAMGLALILAQWVLLRIHLRSGRPASGPFVRPGISVLKPLCGADDDLEANLEAFASLTYPTYEILLGLKNDRDPAYPLACRVAAKWPKRIRVVLQSGSPGFNPKVNQLITLARVARHDLLVISDSNVRVTDAYLDEIATLLQDEAIGLVTHPVAGIGERSLGALMDNLHLATSIGPGMIGAKRAGGVDLVVGKSMAMRRDDLDVLGGFEVAKDVLAEDYIWGKLTTERLGKRVAIGREAALNVTHHRSVKEFIRRYARWATMQRKAVGVPTYCAQVIMNPILMATVATAIAPTRTALGMWSVVVLAKTGLDVAAARAFGRAFAGMKLIWIVPMKDLLWGFAWGIGLVWSQVNWRGNRFRVLDGTYLEPIADGEGWRPIELIAGLLRR